MSDHKIVVTGSINKMFDIRQTKSGDAILGGSITCDGHKAKFYKFNVFSKVCDPQKFSMECAEGAEVSLLVRLGAEKQYKNPDFCDPILWVEDYKVISPAANTVPKLAQVAMDPQIDQIPF